MKALLALVLLTLSLTGCGAKEDPNAVPPPKPALSPEKVVFNHEPGGIRVILDAESDSNLVNDEAHATMICILQSSSREKLMALAASEEGIRQLLECKANPPDIIAASRYFVQPGEERVFPLDRYEGTRFVGVVAGFNTLTPEGCFGIASVPIITDTERSFLIFSHNIYSAGLMKLAVHLGQASLSVTGARREE